MVILVVGVALAAFPGLEALGAPRAAGDIAAWTEVIAAYTRLNALPGYRARVDSPSEELTAEREVIPGRAIHELIHEPKLTLETITVGHVTRHRWIYGGTAGTWQCDSQPRTDERDPTTMRESVLVARQTDAVIDGAAVHVVAYSWEVLVVGRYVTLRTTAYIDPTAGLPRRSVTPLRTGPSNAYTIDYYDYGAKLKIVLPACGS